MKKILLTSLTGLMAVSAAGAFEMSPYVSAKLGWAQPNLAIKGDSLSMALSDEALESLDEDDYASAMSYANSIKNTAEPISIGISGNDQFSLNPAIGAVLNFEDFKLATFRFEVEALLNQDVEQDINLGVLVPNGIVDGTLKTFGLMGNVYVDFKTDCFIKPFVSAGLGYSSMKLDTKIYSDFAEIYSRENWKDKNLAWSVGTGLSFEINSYTNVDLQYRYVDYGQVDIDLGEFDDFQLGIDMENNVHQFLLGIRFTM